MVYKINKINQSVFLDNKETRYVDGYKVSIHYYPNPNNNSVKIFEIEYNEYGVVGVSKEYITSMEYYLISKYYLDEYDYYNLFLKQDFTRDFKSFQQLTTLNEYYYKINNRIVLGQLFNNIFIPIHIPSNNILKELTKNKIAINGYKPDGFCKIPFTKNLYANNILSAIMFGFKLFGWGR